MNSITKKIYLFVTLLIAGVTLGLILKNNPTGDRLIYHILIASSSFLLGIGVWLRKEANEK